MLPNLKILGKLSADSFFSFNQAKLGLQSMFMAPRVLVLRSLDFFSH